MMHRFKTILIALNLINLKELGVKVHYCPICHRKRLMVRLNASHLGVRCLSCRASAISMSIASVINAIFPDIATKKIYEMSCRGPLWVYLKQHVPQFTFSEYFEGVQPGTYVNDVECQDVQCLTYPSDSFDLCTSTEVFEHVVDDAKGFAEVCRVLKPNGVFIFTIPLHQQYKTIERAVQTATGEIKHLLPPEYHIDPLNASKVLAFRTYGTDIIDKLVSAGFAKAEIVKPKDPIAWGFAGQVVVAFRS
jgi:SAM-dependent methyltransferase